MSKVNTCCDNAIFRDISLYMNVIWGVFLTRVKGTKLQLRATGIQLIWFYNLFQAYTHFDFAKLLLKSPSNQIFRSYMITRRKFMSWNQQTSWGNQEKQNMAPLNKPYYDTNTALFTFIHTLRAYVCFDPLSKAS